MSNKPTTTNVIRHYNNKGMTFLPWQRTFGQAGYNLSIDNSSLVTHPLKSSKTIVALLRQGQKAVVLFHTPILQTAGLLSGHQKRDPGRLPYSGQYPRNPLISSLWASFDLYTFDKSTTVSMIILILGV